jgi:hypothetical protein
MAVLDADDAAKAGRIAVMPQLGESKRAACGAALFIC